MCERDFEIASKCGIGRREAAEILEAAKRNHEEIQDNINALYGEQSDHKDLKDDHTETALFRINNVPEF